MSRELSHWGGDPHCGGLQGLRQTCDGVQQSYSAVVVAVVAMASHKWVESVAISARFIKVHPVLTARLPRPALCPHEVHLQKRPGLGWVD